MQRVLTVTPNPAVDVRVAVDELRPGRKLRCDTPVFQPGGGGINVSRAIRELGGESVAFVVTCGETGRFLKSLLDESTIEAHCFDGDGLNRQAVHVQEHCSGDEFQFVPPGPEQSGETLERLWKALLDTLQGGGFDWVVGSGSLPPGLPDGFWATLAGHCRKEGARFVLDTSGPSLEAALDADPYLVKPNRREVERLRPDGEDLVGMAGSLVDEGKAEVVIVTQGRDGALLVAPDERAHLRPPKVEVRSTVGAGDSFVGALVYALANQWSLLDASRHGVAAAAAAVTQPPSELCRAEDVRRIYEEVEVRPVD